MRGFTMSRSDFARRVSVALYLSWNVVWGSKVTIAIGLFVIYGIGRYFGAWG